MSEQRSPSDKEAAEADVAPGGVAPAAATVAEPWERLPSEDNKAFDAFQLFLLLPAKERSVLAAYNAQPQRTGREPAKQASGTWNYWSVAHKWQERARAYEDHLAAIARQEQEKTRREAARATEEAQLKRLEKYRENLADLASANLETSIRLMHLVNARLEQLEKNPAAVDQLPVSALASLLRTASATAAAASAAEAESLAVEHILDSLGEPDYGSNDQAMG